MKNINQTESRESAFHDRLRYYRMIMRCEPNAINRRARGKVKRGASQDEGT